MASFTLLDQAEEDKLHATRLLGIEERPFKRLTKRLLSPSTPIHIFLTRPTKPSSPTDEPNTQTGDTTEPNETSPDPAPDTSLPTTTASETPFDVPAYLSALQRYRSEILLDFSAYTSSLARTQFLLTANESERARYSHEKYQISNQATEVRSHTHSLRGQLEEARKMLEVRKGYDVLARAVLEGEASKRSREELRREIQGLKGEIEESMREGREVQGMWQERRERMGIVVREAERLRRVVRGEVDVDGEEGQEVERDDDAEDEDGEGGGEKREADGEDTLGVDRDVEPASNVGTPAHLEDAPTPLPIPHEGGVATPRSTLADGGTTLQADVVKDTEMETSETTAMAEQFQQKATNASIAVEHEPAQADEMDTT